MPDRSGMAGSQKLGKLDPNIALVHHHQVPHQKAFLDTADCQEGAGTPADVGCFFSYYSCVSPVVGRSEPLFGAYNAFEKEPVYVALGIPGWLLTPSNYAV